MLSVQYVYHEDRSASSPIRVKERRGHITFELCRELYLPEGVAALNSTTARILGGGQWFQLWRGEIVSMYSPEIREFHDGRLHRGPLADQTARR